MILGETLFVAAQVTAVLERLGVPYLVAGSVASSLHGVPRSTQDIDLVADLKLGHVAGFVAALETDFYVDAEMIRDAIRQQGCFNLIHQGTMLKLDLYVGTGDELVQSELTRGRPHEVPLEPPVRFRLASPEDVILHKLDWYRLGGGVSERQWGDVLGVLKVQGTSLDLDYLRQWAARKGLGELLERALGEARRGPGGACRS